MKRLFTVLLAALLLTAGCANTKEETAAGRKNTDQIVRIATTGMEPAAAADTEPAEQTQTPAASPLYEKLGAPVKYQTELTPNTDKLEITVDADVTLPNVEAVPTVRIQARDFTQDEVTRFFHVFCGDTPMYLIRTQSTRADIGEKLEKFREEAKTAEGARLEKVKQNIAYYEAEYEKAPETIVDVPTDGTMFEQQYGNPVYLAKYMGVSAREFPERDYGGKTFGVRNNYYDLNTKTGYDFNVGAGLGYTRDSRWGSLFSVNPLEYIRDETTVPAAAASELTSTPLEARQLVETFWKENGFSDMGISGVYLAYNGNKETMKIDEHDTYGQKHAYVVACGKSINGVVPISDDAIWDGQVWFHESCNFIVSDAGIETFSWRSPNSYTEVVTADTAMLPFDRIDEIFRKMILVQYESNAAGNTTGKLFSYHVDRVSLDLQRVLEQGSQDTGLLVPVWDFYGTFEFWYTNGDHYGSEIEQGFRKPLLSINAIDGSIIDPREGY